jgi:hypothetical protein
VDSASPNPLRSGCARAALAVVTAAMLGACGHGDGAQSIADATTKAIYDDDVTAMQARFDDDLRKAVTLEQVATLSTKLHALGSYDGLAQTAADAPAGRYDYSARFAKTTIPVHLRLDTSGRVAAYRLDIPEPEPAANP